jgi:hypothetical protein
MKNLKKNILIILDNLLDNLLDIFYWILLFILLFFLWINYNHDYIVIRRENEMDFWILEITFYITSLYIFISYFYKKYKITYLFHIFILLIIYWLIQDVWLDYLSWSNVTIDYFYYFYIGLFITYLLLVIIYFFIEKKNNKNFFKRNK